MGEALDIDEHSHRFAAWAAATGASASPACRFTVGQGKAILEAAGFKADLRLPRQLPSPARIDRTHAIWRRLIIKAAARHRLRFSHGVAAKLINLYLKSRFTLAGHEDNPRVAALHPPVDSLLLRAINKGLPRDRRLPTNWSKFDSTTYHRVISQLRAISAPAPFWTIETNWQGHR